MTNDSSTRIYVDHLLTDVVYRFQISRDTGDVFVKRDDTPSAKFMMLRSPGLGRTMFPFYVDETTWVVKYVPGLFDVRGEEFQYYQDLAAYFTITSKHLIELHPVNRDTIPVTWDVHQNNLKRAPRPPNSELTKNDTRRPKRPERPRHARNGGKGIT